MAPFVASASVEITEIMYDLPGADSGHEWVEITNTGSDPVDVSGYRLFEANVNHKLTLAQGGGTLSPGQAAVIADATSTFMGDWPQYAGTLFDSSFSLSNTNETIGIKDDSLNLLDSVTYDASGGAAGDGNSLHRVGDTMVPGAPDPGVYTGAAPAPLTQEDAAPADPAPAADTSVSTDTAATSTSADTATSTPVADDASAPAQTQTQTQEQPQTPPPTTTATTQTQTPPPQTQPTQTAPAQQTFASASAASSTQGASQASTTATHAVTVASASGTSGANTATIASKKTSAKNVPVVGHAGEEAAAADAPAVVSLSHLLFTWSAGTLGAVLMLWAAWLWLSPGIRAKAAKETTGGAHGFEIEE